ncbi:hypothetical protein HPP92_028959 [Vanilla planifolia]|uniref:Uncharacterized protein n=1 Tax=Vanilla planifolia TaxID=51239 RepID=A0A835P3H5_VANPL|nr:hypothetical protein HPP92_028959 [Vanilla planifolia]KAG0446195.1 hypothetical protein HPP92_028948 [Vanilla planifolia]
MEQYNNQDESSAQLGPCWHSNFRWARWVVAAPLVADSIEPARRRLRLAAGRALRCLSADAGSETIWLAESTSGRKEGRRCSQTEERADNEILAHEAGFQDLGNKSGKLILTINLTPPNIYFPLPSWIWDRSWLSYQLFASLDNPAILLFSSWLYCFRASAGRQKDVKKPTSCGAISKLCLRISERGDLKRCMAVGLNGGPSSRPSAARPVCFPIPQQNQSLAMVPRPVPIPSAFRCLVMLRIPSDSGKQYFSRWLAWMVHGLFTWMVQMSLAANSFINQFGIALQLYSDDEWNGQSGSKSFWLACERHATDNSTNLTEEDIEPEALSEA